MNEVRSPEQIERQIDELRLQIGHTLDAMGDKLSPGQLLDQALSYAKESTGAFAGNFTRSVRDNPLPATLLGISLAWLMLAGNREPRAPATPPRHGNGKLRAIASSARSAGEQTREAIDETRERTLDTFADAQETLEQVADTARAGLTTVAGRLRDAGDSAKMGIVRTRAGMVRSAEATSAFVRDNPLSVAAVALAAGALMAALMPRTRREDDLMGEARDEVVQRVDEAAAAVAEEGVDAAGRVAETAVEVAEERLEPRIE